MGSAVYFGVLGLLGWPVWIVCARMGERPPSKLRMALVHLLMGALLVAAWQAVYLGCLRSWMGSAFTPRMRAMGLWMLLASVGFYAGMIAGIVAVQTSRRLREQMRRQSELRLLAREAELRALRSQIRPHFFFNVMNSIYSLIEHRPREAQEMVELVAGLMRQTLDAAEQDLVPLHWELDAVETYLRIEKIRLGDELAVHVERDPDGADCAVPPFVLQPLVENAIKHGVAPFPGPGAVRVSTRIAGDQLEMTVCDSGPGYDAAACDDERVGRGLSITHRRLENLYGDAFAIARRNLQPSGCEVRIAIPRQPLRAAAMANGG